MKKLLLLSDGSNFPAGAFELIKYLHEREAIAVSGFFYASVSYEMLVASSLSASVDGFLSEVNERSQEVKQQIDAFVHHCTVNQIDFSVHREPDTVALDDIIKESRFADLLLISEELYCKDFDTVQPNAYMKELLHRSECPVLLVPEKFREPAKIIICYDGSKECLFAIKYFVNLLSLFTKIETELVFIKDEDGRDIPDMEYLEAYVAKHFSNLTINKLPFNAEKFFTKWLECQDSPFVVSGSFGRSALSLVLRHSFIESVISEHLSPIFIAHNS